MKKIYLFSFVALIFFNGCFNKRGFTMTYYSDCEEYYDLQGFYHKKCGNEIFTYDDVKKIWKKEEKKDNTINGEVSPF
jgi:hypothetical protein